MPRRYSEARWLRQHRPQGTRTKDSESPLLFEVFLDANDQWRWRLVGANGEIIAQSGAYDSRANAERTIERIKQAALTAPIEVIT